MKKFIVVFFITLLVWGNAFAFSPAELDNALKSNVEQTMRARGLDVAVTVERLKQLDEPKGFFFYRVTIRDKKNPASMQEQYLFFNGTYISSDFIDIKINTSVSKDLRFELSETKINTSKLTLLYGKRGAKNTVVKVTDFECTFCRAANAYLENLVKSRNDVAVYIIHLPLQRHQKAEIMARVFEAGNIMGRNFSGELFSNDKVLEMSEEQMLTHFATRSGNPARFRELVRSEEVSNILQTSANQTESMGITGTPVIFINGRRIDGFDRTMIDRAFANIK